jgi:hypothetical protein
MTWVSTWASTWAGTWASTLSGVAGRLSYRRRRVARGLMLLPMLTLCAVVLAAAYVSYVLWPRWPGPAVRPSGPALPIVVGEVTFNIPPDAIRVPVQRKPGVQDRVDLAFLWPALVPGGATAALHAVAPGDVPKPIDRLFVTITAANGALSPIERFKTIYPRYTEKEPVPTAAGLVAFSFRDETPYQGEDLLYEAADPERFFIRCTHAGPGHVPGTCLAERRMRSADMIVRFPRDWLTDWRAVAGGIDRLIGSLKPR